MLHLRDVLEEAERELEACLREVRRSLKRARGLPEGRLRISHRGGRTEYYICGAEESGNGRYLRVGQRELARSIAQRDYDRRVERILLRQLEDIGRCLRHCESDEILAALERLHADRRALVAPVRLSDAEFAAAWLEESYRKKRFAEGTAEIFTEKGERVRSKSEKIIADKLWSMKIPYKYERPLHLQGAGVVHPDFTVLNVRLRKEIYLEHLGMMDDPEYSAKAVRKIEAYELNGVMQGDRLLLTYETKKSPLNAKLLELLVKKYLI